MNAFKRNIPVSPIVIIALWMFAVREVYASDDWWLLGFLIIGGIHHLYLVRQSDREHDAEFMRKHTIQD